MFTLSGVLEEKENADSLTFNTLWQALEKRLAAVSQTFISQSVMLLL